MLAECFMRHMVTTQATVSDLVRNFAEACRALVPNLDRASVPWADGQQHDNWDRIAEALFESLVLEPCRFHAAAVFPSTVLKLERYGFKPAGANAFVSLNASLGGEDCSFVQLISRESPFDGCEGWSSDSKLVVPIDDAELSFVVLDADGARHKIKNIDLRL
jgi:hypothetical protein